MTYSAATYSPSVSDIDIEIDVDLSSMFGVVSDPAHFVKECWYHLAKPKSDRHPLLQQKSENILAKAIATAEYAASRAKPIDRRQSIRTTMLTRLTMTDFGDKKLMAIDISATGIRCTGKPCAPIMNIEFKIPGQLIPIDVRVEVMNFKDANLFPIIGLRFIDLQRPYAKQIERYLNIQSSKQASPESTSFSSDIVGKKMPSVDTKNALVYPIAGAPRQYNYRPGNTSLASWAANAVNKTSKAA